MRPGAGRIRGIIVGLAVLAVLVVVPKWASVTVWSGWFASLGYAGVYWTNFYAAWGFGLAGALAAAALVGANVYTAGRLLRSSSVAVPGGSRTTRALVLWSSLLAALLGGGMGGAAWLRFLTAWHRAPSPVRDGVFHRSLSFYLFQLPALVTAQRDLLFLLLIGLVLVGAVYAMAYAAARLDVTQARPVVRHGAVLLGLILVVWAWGDYLARYRLMAEPSHYLVGPGYVTMHVYLPLLGVKALVALAGGLFLLGAGLAGRARLWTPAVPVGALVAVSVLGSIYGGLLENYVVSPNQLAQERPYIAAYIAGTNRAFGTSQVRVRQYPAKGQVSKADLAADAGTIRNLRIMDYRPLTQAYQQLQGLRLYYNFSTVTLDRYVIDGRETEVLLAPRELKQSLLPAAAQTWVNLHERYTHGYGVVMSPVNAANAQGEPEFLERDIPPRGVLHITQPELYFGLDTTDWVITDTRGGEFNYTAHGRSYTNQYHGRDGLPLTGWTKLALSLNMGTTRFYFDHELTARSRVLLDRQILTRIRRIAPFLRLDSDPYVVVAGGRIYWIVDAYTTSDRYPYANRVNFHGTPVNYIRNSVKVVVDAYNGTVTFYRMPGNDPIVATLGRVYPGLFRPLSAMPADLRAHLRYPEDLFNAQAQVLQNFHMTDPTTFYNREDAWSQSTEAYSGSTTRTESYYAMVRLPGQVRPEMVLMTSFTPIHRHNMVAWLAASMGLHNYGQLTLEEFPKGRQIYGPMQVEALIQQNPTISQEFTLWGQHGSRVVQGNLLVIPVHGALLYVEPVFLESTASGNASIPELKRVIVVSGDRVVMERDLATALSQLTGAAVPPTTATPTVPGNLLDQAWQEYLKAEQAAGSGDWSSFGQDLQQLGKDLQTLRGGSGAAGATPAP